MKQKRFNRILAFALAFVMVFTGFGTGNQGINAAWANESANQVRVIVENTTFTTEYCENNGINEPPAWEGTLVDTWVPIDAESTMMSCLLDALGTYTQTGAEANYISEINGLYAASAGGYDGWMATLNDWFINEGMGSFTVAEGKLAAGDEIRIVYSLNMGEDLGGTWSNNDKTVSRISFSTGTLDKEFASDVKEYTLTVPRGTSGITLTPTATNKNFQVRTFLIGADSSKTEYKRTESVPVSDGSVVKVICGDPSWPSMNGGSYGDADNVPAEEYIFTVNYENNRPVRKAEVEAEVTKTTDFNEGFTLNLNDIFSDPDGDALSFAVSIDDAEAVSADAQYSYSFTEADKDKTHTFVFSAKESTGEQLSTEDTYKVTVNVIEKQQADLASLIVHTGSSPSNSNVLLRNASDTYTTDVVFDTDTNTYNLASQLDTLPSMQLRFRAKPAIEGDKVTLKYFNGGSKDITWTSGSSKYVSNCIQAGKNTLEIVVGSDSDTSKAKTYTLHIDVKPTLTGITAAAASPVYMNKTFKATTYEYTLTLPDTLEEITLNAVPKGTEYEVLYNGTTASTVNIKELDKVEITVSAGSGTARVENKYIVNLNKVKSITFTPTVTPADAVIMVYGPDGTAIGADGDGSYTGLFGDLSYSYTVSKKGYISASGKVPSTGGSFAIELEQAEASTLKDVKAEWKNFRNSDTNNGVTSAKTPIDEKQTALFWNAKLGSGYAAAPSPQIIVDDALIVMSGKNIYKLNLENGEILKTGTMAEAPSYSYTPPTYAEGMIFCPLGNGTVQAFNAETLESLWIYKDNLKGQALSPITYSDGYVYTGFWNGETADANFVCISVTDENPAKTDEEKVAAWKHTQQGGFYWVGSVVVGDAVIVGTDNGVSDSTSASGAIYSFNKTTGTVISKHTNLVGDQRSAITYDETTKNIYFTTKAGYLYKAAVNPETGEVGTPIGNNKHGDTEFGQSTSTPVVYDGKIYFTVGGGIYAKGAVLAADAETLELVAKAEMPFYPQCSVLLSNAHENTGKLYLYATYNGNPGGIHMIEVPTALTSGTVTELTPVEIYDAAGFSQYCICSIICDEEGTLYYKNDSGNIFAVGTSLESIDTRKTTAKTELDNYVSTYIKQENYRTAEWETIQNEITKGKTAIDTANSLKAVNTALVAAKSAIDAVKTDAELKAEEGQTPAKGITVSFRLIGAQGSAEDIDFSKNDYKGVKYVTWIATRNYSFDSANVTVGDLFKKALNQAGLSYTGLSTNYISSITAPGIYGGYQLAEFTNGAYSGWMYTVNGSHPEVGLNNCQLNNGDAVVWHYVNDYRYEVSDWHGGSIGQSSNWNNWLGAADVDPPTSGPVIDMSGTAPEEVKDVTTSKDSGTTITSTEVTVSGSTATATITKENVTETIKQATENKSAEIVVQVTDADTKGAETVKVQLDTTTVKDVVNKTDAVLTVKTENAVVTLDRETLKTVAAEATGSTVTLEVIEVAKPTEAHKEAAGENGHVIQLVIKSGSKVISLFNEGKATVTVEIPAKLNGKKVAAIHIGDDGKIEHLKGQEVTVNGKKHYRFDTPHFSTFALVDADEIGLEVEEQMTAEEVKALIADLTPVVRSAKTPNKNTKVTLKLDAADKAIIEELEAAGYTVKYNFYRSTKKSSKYKSMLIKEGKTYTNTKGKKGEIYYYKARVQVYDAEGKLIARTALKDCRYANRKWTK